jgi:hypothetical protein
MHMSHQIMTSSNAHKLMCGVHIMYNHKVYASACMHTYIHTEKMHTKQTHESNGKRAPSSGAVVKVLGTWHGMMQLSAELHSLTNLVAE